jgi:PAS domain S-box-containing protein
MVHILPLYSKVLESDQISHQYRLKDTNGSWHWIDSIEIVYKRETDGTPLQILGIARDISDRKVAQAALFESEQLLHNLNLLAKEGLMIHENGIILDANLAYATMLGYSSVKEIIGKQGIEVLSVTDQSKQKILEHFQKHSTKSYEIEKITENGSLKYFETRAEHISYKGRVARLVFLNDISERKNAELALLEREQRFQQITSLSGIMVYEFVVESKKIVFGGAIEKITGYLPLEFESITFEQWSRFIHPDETTSVVESFIQSARLLQPFRIEYRMLNKQNEYIWIEIESFVLSDDGKVPSSIIGVIQDITNTKALERQILNSVIETEEKERLHFSQELHDGIGPLLSASKMYVNWLTKPNAIQDKSEIIQDIDKLLNESIKTVREISFKLSPHILLHYGLVEALKIFIDKIIESTTLSIDLHTVNIERFDEKVEIVVYRVLCECINNTLKHAEATTIKIDLICTKGVFKVSYYDNGCGFESTIVPNPNHGIGLLNMQSRLKSINGKMNIISIPQQGTTIKIDIKI